jgi:4-hydroxybenzoate polyprenyltransferase
MYEKPIALMRTMRPMTWISVIFTIFAGMMISLQTIPPAEDIIFISGLLPVFVLGYANTLNAYTDYRIDEITRPQRAIPKGIIKKEHVLYFAAFLFVGALVLSIFVLDLFLSSFVIAGLLLATTYSARPTRIKVHGLAAPVAIAAGYVFIPFVGASLLYSPLRADVLLIALILTVQTAGASVSKDFIDLEGDKALNVTTVPLLTGLKRARSIVLAGLVVPLVAFPLLSLGNAVPHWFLMYLLLLPWLIYILFLYRDEHQYEKAYIHTFFFCAVSILLSGIAYTGGI